MSIEQNKKLVRTHLHQLTTTMIDFVESFINEGGDDPKDLELAKACSASLQSACSFAEKQGWHEISNPIELFLTGGMRL